MARKDWHGHPVESRASTLSGEFAEKFKQNNPLEPGIASQGVTGPGITEPGWTQEPSTEEVLGRIDQVLQDVQDTLPFDGIVSQPTILPKAAHFSTSVSTVAPTQTVGVVGLVEIPAWIVVARLTCRLVTVGTVAGATIRAAVYSPNGQSKRIDTVSPDLNGGVARAVTWTVSPVPLKANYYWFLFVRDDAGAGTNPAFALYGSTTANWPGGAPVAGRLVFTGTIVTVGGAAPATIDPAVDITYNSAGRTPIIRLDNA